jgi:hypothetical protein
MTTILLSGEITPDGQLLIQLPEGLPTGQVQVSIELPETTDVKPLTGAEIIAAGLVGTWSDVQIDGQEWVEQQRQRRRENRNR